MRSRCSRSAVLCRLIGHHWAWAGAIRYEQGRAMAYIGDAPEMQEVNVTWVCDEVCERCGAETWWPT